ncbi:Transcriptional regulator, LysR family [gamma proteobacterium HdN1]|nr:Transcriptional regulator, LysR family [gamma proteobacterium HdN1]
MEISLDQWQTLVTIVDQGGYAKAAEHLGKSQSAISYAIQKLESSLELQVFRIEGRRAVLTPAGELLYQRAVRLVGAAHALENTARQLSQHWQAQISLAVETVFPKPILFDALRKFSDAYPLTRIHLLETVLSGTSEALISREVSLAISSYLPPGFMGDALIQLRFIAVAAPSHPLHQLKRPLTYTDLQQHRQLVVRDSGTRNLDAGWLGAEQRWTFNELSTSIQAAIAGFGFAWYPESQIATPIDQGQLKPLPLESGGERYASLYLIYAEPEFASPACVELGRALHASSVYLGGCAAAKMAAQNPP